MPRIYELPAIAGPLTGAELVAGTRNGETGAIATADIAALAAGAGGSVFQPLNASLTTLSGKTIGTFGLTLLATANQGAAQTALGIVPTSTDGNLTANSNALVATQKAVKTYVDTKIASALNFRGTINCAGNPNYPAASIGDAYVVSAAGQIGGGSGTIVDIGDMLLATAANAGGTQGAVGASWTILERNLQGALLAANNLSDVASVNAALNNLLPSQVGQAGKSLVSDGTNAGWAAVAADDLDRHVSTWSPNIAGAGVSITVYGLVGTGLTRPPQAGSFSGLNTFNAASYYNSRAKLVLSPTTSGANDRSVLLPMAQPNGPLLRGASPGVGGFRVFMFGGPHQTATDGKVFMGISAYNSTSLPAGTVEPSTITDCVGIGVDSSDGANLQLIYNNASGAATKVDLGSNFPARSAATDFYRLEMSCTANGSSITYRVTRMNTGQATSGTITGAKLPTATALLQPIYYATNGPGTGVANQTNWAVGAGRVELPY